MFKNKFFLSIQMTNFISLIGDIIFYPVMLILATKTNNVLVFTAYVTLSESLPKLLVIPFIPKVFKIKDKRIYLSLSFIIRALIYCLIAILLLNFNSSIFIIILILNVISDLLGLATAQIEIDYTKKIINDISSKDFDDNYPKGLAISSTLRNTAQLFGILLGTFLLNFLGYSNIAIFNALTFFIGFFLLIQCQKKFKLFDQEQFEKTSEEKIKVFALFKKIFLNKAVRNITFLTGMINVVINQLIITSNLVFSKNKPVFLSHHNLIFIVMLSITGALILGSFYASSSAKKRNIYKLFALFYFLASLTFISFVFVNEIILIPLIFSTIFVCSLIQPLIFKELLTHIEYEELGMLASAINILMQLLTPVSIVISTLIIGFINIYVFIFGLLITLLVLSYFCFNTKD